LASVAWIFFRANHLSDALYIISHLLTGWRGLLHPGLKETPFLGPLKFEFMVAVFSVALLLLVQAMEGQGRIVEKISGRPVWLRWPIYYGIVLSILLFGNFGSKQFIYFQF